MGVMQGILRGIKQQRKTAIAVLIGPWLTTLPLAAILAFDKSINFKIFGLWIGNVVGYIVMDIIFFYILSTFKWHKKHIDDDNNENIIDKSKNNLILSYSMGISHFSAFCNASTFRIDNLKQR